MDLSGTDFIYFKISIEEDGLFLTSVQMVRGENMLCKLFAAVRIAGRVD